jgi:hypothetical protein
MFCGSASFELGGIVSSEYVILKNSASQVAVLPGPIFERDSSDFANALVPDVLKKFEQTHVSLEVTFSHVIPGFAVKPGQDEFMTE